MHIYPLISFFLKKIRIKNRPGSNSCHKKSKQKKRKNQIEFKATEIIYRITGVDFSKVKGFNDNVLLAIISETGLDMSKWPSVKHFAAWLAWR